ncbi:hypothetical protein L7F22_004518 [Adiantum nelumboides]|nr:hypothetical protein [Adiantum nelumboides]
MKTEVGYRFAPSGKAYPDNWIITDTVYEVEGGTLQSRSGADVAGDPSPASGDGTLPYNSLSFCKTWLGSWVNITRVPQTSHDGSDVQEIVDFEHELGTDIVPNMSRDSRANYITFYEDETSYPGRKTAVWEFDKVNHRNMVRSPYLMRELWLELTHSAHPAAQRKFMPKEAMALYLRGRTPQLQDLPMRVDISLDLLEQEYVDDIAILSHKSSGFVVGLDDVCRWGGLDHHPALHWQFVRIVGDLLHSGSSFSCGGGYAMETMDLGGLPFVIDCVRYPIRDEDCFWDYAKARCAFSEYCEYRYVFGDVHLGQSCRLKLSKIGDILVKYL